MSKIYCQESNCKYNNGSIDARDGLEHNGSRYYMCLKDTVFIGNIYCHSYMFIYQKEQDAPKGTGGDISDKDKSGT